MTELNNYQKVNKAEFLPVFLTAKRNQIFDNLFDQNLKVLTPLPSKLNERNKPKKISNVDIHICQFSQEKMKSRSPDCHQKQQS